LNPQLLECALRCFPASHLRLWFEWIVRDEKLCVASGRSGAIGRTRQSPVGADLRVRGFR
jgi:hypothetical protein